MPTLLEFCKIPVPDTSEGENLFGERKRQVLFGEISEGPRATRMIMTDALNSFIIHGETGFSSLILNRTNGNERSVREV